LKGKVMHLHILGRIFLRILVANTFLNKGATIENFEKFLKNSPT
jgi:hypothetical protein